MAYYPPDFVERIRLIKRLQEERFMPLRLIKGVIDDDPERARALVELEDRILERAAARAGARAGLAGRGPPPLRGPRQRARRASRSWSVLTPNSRGYDADDVGIIEAISRFRAGGYDERSASPSTTPCATGRRSQPLVEEEVGVLLDRLAGEVDVDRAVEIIAAGAEPLRELIGAMHSKLLLAELRRATDRRT